MNMNPFGGKPHPLLLGALVLSLGGCGSSDRAVQPGVPDAGGQPAPGYLYTLADVQMMGRQAAVKRDQAEQDRAAAAADREAAAKDRAAAAAELHEAKQRSLEHSAPASQPLAPATIAEPEQPAASSTSTPAGSLPPAQTPHVETPTPSMEPQAFETAPAPVTPADPAMATPAPVPAGDVQTKPASEAPAAQ